MKSQTTPWILMCFICSVYSLQDCPVVAVPSCGCRGPGVGENSYEGNFIMQSVSCKCPCNGTFNNLISYSGNNTVSIQRGYGAFHYKDNNETVVGFCIFCSILDLSTAITGDMVMVQQSGQVLPECLENAEGFFCSRCKPGYHFNLGRHCVKCNNLARDRFVFVLAEFIPITLLLLILLLMNWSLVGGKMAATVFFAQMVTTTMDIDGEGLIPITNATNNKTHIAYSIEAAYHFIYEPFNLNFIYPFVNDLCLTKSPSYLMYFVVQYVVAAYPLMLCLVIGIVLYVLKCMLSRDRIPNWAKRILLLRDETDIVGSYGNVLASSILLAYAKFILISAYIIIPSPLFDQHGNIVKWALFYDPNLEYFKNSHIWYFIIALIMMVFLFSLPFFLFLLRHEDEEAEYSCKWTKVLLHPFQRDYRKDCDHEFCQQYKLKWRHLSFKFHDYRWVPGLYLALRLFFILTLALASIGLYKFIVQYLIQALVCLSFLIFILIARPYEECWHYISDAPIFIALIAINLFNMYQFHQAYNDQNLSLPIFIIQVIILLLPVMVWIIYIVVFLIRKAWACFSTNEEVTNIRPRSNAYGSIHSETST